jgi:hypothetical protein
MGGFVPGGVSFMVCWDKKFNFHAKARRREGFEKKMKFGNVYLPLLRAFAPSREISWFALFFDDDVPEISNMPQCL